LLESVPGIGRALAERLHRDFEIDSLEDLEAAAHDGRLSDIAGIDKKKLAGKMNTLTIRLGRVRLRTLATKADEPPIEELLDGDREYRDKAAANELSMIAPRRFNLSGEAWLPIPHTIVVSAFTPLSTQIRPTHTISAGHAIGCCSTSMVDWTSASARS
jgi:hypothetical protein